MTYGDTSGLRWERQARGEDEDRSSVTDMRKPCVSEGSSVLVAACVNSTQRRAGGQRAVCSVKPGPRISRGYKDMSVVEADELGT